LAIFSPPVIPRRATISARGYAVLHDILLAMAQPILDKSSGRF
jgi:hypothetical protein